MDDESPELAEASKELRHNPERSLEICESYVREHPVDPNGLFARFQALTRLGEYERALDDINRVVELDPNCAGYAIRGAFFHDRGEHERAVQDLTRARKLDENEFKTSYDPLYRADSYARLGRLDEALADCELITEDHWMPEGVFGLPGGNKEEFIAEIKRRAALARNT